MAKKQTPRKRKQTRPALKTPLQFSIDLDIKGIIVFTALACLTALVVFYLGVIFGKAARTPNLATIQAKKTFAPQKATEQEISQKDLEIYSIREDGAQIKSLQSDTKNVLAEADRVLKKSQKRVAVTPAKPTTTKPKPAEQWPNQASAQKKSHGLYTVQVFATKDQEKAKRIVRLLRKKEFDAYLVSVTIEKQLIYRVRIGRKSKAEVEKLNQKLGPVVGGMGMKSRIIKLN